MAEVISSLFDFIKKYNSTSFTLVLLLIALAFLWFTEKSKNIRTTLIYLSLAIMAVVVCPLYAWIGLKIDDEIYYRTFWMIPVGLLFSYASVKAVIYFKGWIQRILIAVLVIAIIILNGKLVYTNSFRMKATNKYHIPELVIQVADALDMGDYNPVAVMPKELLPFLRQYSCNILTPYGRNILEVSWGEKYGFTNALYDAMEADVYDTELIAQRAREERCQFVVLSSIKEQKGSMIEQGYLLQEIAGGYYIYIDKNYYEAFKDLNLLGDRHFIY